VRRSEEAMMEKSSYRSADGAPAVGPYSPALAAGDLVFLSGQIALDGAGQVVGVTAPEQARKALENVRSLLAAAGLGMDAVVKTTVFLTDMDDFVGVNDVYASFFEEPYPARSTVEVARLPKDVWVEIEAIARRE
jgi:2-iminobutanoate/2-iminopropanoate deaminase